MNVRKHQEVFIFWKLELAKGYKVLRTGPMRPISRAAIYKGGVKRKRKTGHGLAVQPPGTTETSDGLPTSMLQSPGKDDGDLLMMSTECG